MKRMLIVLALMALALPAMAQQVCPEEGKVEANGGNQAEINSLVLEAGTEVCIKGGQTLVTVTADGTATLAELLGSGQDVSHYTVLSSVSTTTTVPTEETTTTIPSEETPSELETLEELPFTGIGYAAGVVVGLALLALGLALISSGNDQ